MRTFNWVSLWSLVPNLKKIGALGRNYPSLYFKFSAQRKKKNPKSSVSDPHLSSRPGICSIMPPRLAEWGNMSVLCVVQYPEMIVHLEICTFSAGGSCFRG